MWEVASYTSATAAETVDGIGGFNFTAASPGMTPTDRSTIRSHLLHRIHPGWEDLNDPLLHPPTFAYLHRSGRYYLARGISTGTTPDGRGGNILTEAVMTTDPADFGPWRPAQLFGATLWWQMTKLVGTLPTRPTPISTGRLTEQNLWKTALHDPWASTHLPHLATMAEETLQGKRLAIITTDLDQAQQWTALATLLLPPDAALSLSIRGMVADPMTTPADIVASSPHLGPQPDPTRPHPGINIIDLDRLLISPVSLSPSARDKADAFLHRPAPSTSGTAPTQSDLEMLAVMVADLAQMARGLQKEIAEIPPEVLASESAHTQGLAADETATRLQQLLEDLSQNPDPHDFPVLAKRTRKLDIKFQQLRAYVDGIQDAASAAPARPHQPTGRPGNLAQERARTWPPAPGNLDTWVNQWLIPTYDAQSLLAGWDTNPAIRAEVTALYLGYAQLHDPKAGPWDPITWLGHRDAAWRRIETLRQNHTSSTTLAWLRPDNH